MGKIKPLSQKGFTLIELIVAVAIFLLALTAVVSMFLISLKNQRRDFLIQNLQDNIRYIMETIIKETRMSIILNPNGQNQRLMIANQEANIVIYEFNSSSGQIFRQEITAEGEGEPESISSSKVRIDGSFYIMNEDNEQGRATIVMQARPSSAAEPNVKIQSTVTSRAYIKMEIPGL